METARRLFLGLMAGFFVFGSAAHAQDTQTLGDVARRQRQQREQSAVMQGKEPAESKVITNEEIPEHAGEEPIAGKDKSGGSGLPTSKTPKQTADFWRSRIQTEKGQMAYLQRRIDDINASIRFSSVNCGANCVLRNERQRSKQQQVEQMHAELDRQKKRVEQMQESARKQGYGSSVYDP
jgi:hypothetical protein